MMILSSNSYFFQKKGCQNFLTPYNAHPLSRQTAPVVRLEKKPSDDRGEKERKS